MGFADRLEKERHQCIYLVRGTDSTGQQAWYYFQVDDAKAAAFQRATSRGEIQLTDWGEILHSGYGESPPEDVKKRMREEHGFAG